MTIRPARGSDLPVIAALAARAFKDDELFGQMMHPQRDEYYADFEAFWLHMLREKWWDYTRIRWVSTVEENSKEVIVGFADWELKGTAAEKYKLWKMDPRNVVQPVIKAYHAHLLRKFPNRALNTDPALANPFPANYRFFAHNWSGGRANSIYLDLLGVNPDYQGRGLARELVQWGLDFAKDAGICASVISSQRGHGLYLKMGFIDVGHTGVGGEENVFNRLESGWIMFTEVPQERNKQADAAAAAADEGS